MFYLVIVTQKKGERFSRFALDWSWIPLTRRLSKNRLGRLCQSSRLCSTRLIQAWGARELW